MIHCVLSDSSTAIKRSIFIPNEIYNSKKLLTIVHNFKCIVMKQTSTKDRVTKQIELSYYFFGDSHYNNIMINLGIKCLMGIGPVILIRR